MSADLVEEPPDGADERHDELVRLASMVFVGEHPALVGSVLSELFAIYLASHLVDDATHEELLKLHVESVRQLLPGAKARIAEMRRRRAQ